MSCVLCMKTGPHFHIIVENGRVKSVEHISTKDYWNRELPRDDYTVLTKTEIGVRVDESPMRRVLHHVKQMARALRNR
jgi:hypothetical protein